MPETKYFIAFFALGLMYLVLLAYGVLPITRSNQAVAGARWFRSPVASNVAALGALGFLGALGIVPGWQRLFGFVGFFGLIGVAYMIETIVRFRNRTA
jgi:hypothetical protein